MTQIDKSTQTEDPQPTPCQKLNADDSRMKILLDNTTRALELLTGHHTPKPKPKPYVIFDLF